MKLLFTTYLAVGFFSNFAHFFTGFSPNNKLTMYGDPSVLSTECTAGDPSNFVIVGDPGNAPDPATGYGTVEQTYQIAKTDITVGQYCAFLNAVATTDTYGLYDTRMASDTAISSIQRIPRLNKFVYAVVSTNGHQTTNAPITYVSWLSAARFCNWLQNGQPSGNQDASTTEKGVYNLNGATNYTDSSIFVPAPGASYFLPTENQWYKAAYYKGGSTNAGYWSYPTQSNDAPGNAIGGSPNQANIYYNGNFATGSTPYLTPVGSFTGSAGYYGTYDMGGDVCQWFTGTDSSGNPSLVGFRGGDWSNPSTDKNVPNIYQYPSANLISSAFRDTVAPNFSSKTLGFRLAAPENLVPPPKATPTPASSPTPANTPLPTPTPAITPNPTPTPLPTITPEPTANPVTTPIPITTPLPNSSPVSTVTPLPTNLPSPNDFPINIDLVLVGDPNNEADTTTYGAVSEVYKIGKTDITAAQYCAFLNAVAKTGDPYGLYDSRMTTDTNVSCIQRLGEEGDYTYIVIHDPSHERYGFPITYVSWFSAARFCNWLQNKQAVGPEGPGTTETGSYNLNGATTFTDPSIFQITPGANYIIPTEDQWYKAAYYKGGNDHAGYWKYPTQSDELPRNTFSYFTSDIANIYLAENWWDKYSTGSAPYLTPVAFFSKATGPYKTYDMGGDVNQWMTSTTKDPNKNCAVFRGGDWSNPADDTNAPADLYQYPSATLINSVFRNVVSPDFKSNTIGFRVAFVDNLTIRTTSTPSGRSTADDVLIGAGAVTLATIGAITGADEIAGACAGIGSGVTALSEWMRGGDHNAAAPGSSTLITRGNNALSLSNNSQEIEDYWVQVKKIPSHDNISHGYVGVNQSTTTTPADSTVTHTPLSGYQRDVRLSGSGIESAIESPGVVVTPSSESTANSSPEVTPTASNLWATLVNGRSLTPPSLISKKSSGSGTSALQHASDLSSNKAPSSPAPSRSSLGSSLQDGEWGTTIHHDSTTHTDSLDDLAYQTPNESVVENQNLEKDFPGITGRLTNLRNLLTEENQSARKLTRGQQTALTQLFQTYTNARALTESLIEDSPTFTPAQKNNLSTCSSRLQHTALSNINAILQAREDGTCNEEEIERFCHSFIGCSESLHTAVQNRTRRGAQAPSSPNEIISPVLGDRIEQFSETYSLANSPFLGNSAVEGSHLSISQTASGASNIRLGLTQRKLFPYKNQGASIKPTQTIEHGEVRLQNGETVRFGQEEINALEHESTTLNASIYNTAQDEYVQTAYKIKALKEECQAAYRLKAEVGGLLETEGQEDQNDPNRELKELIFKQAHGLSEKMLPVYQKLVARLQSNRYENVDQEREYFEHLDQYRANLVSYLNTILQSEKDGSSPVITTEQLQHDYHQLQQEAKKKEASLPCFQDTKVSDSQEAELTTSAVQNRLERLEESLKQGSISLTNAEVDALHQLSKTSQSAHVLNAEIDTYLDSLPADAPSNPAIERVTACNEKLQETVLRNINDILDAKEKGTSLPPERISEFFQDVTRCSTALDRALAQFRGAEDQYSSSSDQRTTPSKSITSNEETPLDSATKSIEEFSQSYSPAKSPFSPVKSSQRDLLLQQESSELNHTSRSLTSELTATPLKKEEAPITPTTEQEQAIQGRLENLFNQHQDNLDRIVSIQPVSESYFNTIAFKRELTEALQKRTHLSQDQQDLIEIISMMVNETQASLEASVSQSLDQLEQGKPIPEELTAESELCNWLVTSLHSDFSELIEGNSSNITVDTLAERMSQFREVSGLNKSTSISASSPHSPLTSGKKDSSHSRSSLKTTSSPRSDHHNSTLDSLPNVASLTPEQRQKVDQDLSPVVAQMESAIQQARSPFSKEQMIIPVQRSEQSTATWSSGTSPNRTSDTEIKKSPSYHSPLSPKALAWLLGEAPISTIRQNSAATLPSRLENSQDVSVYSPIARCQFSPDTHSPSQIADTLSPQDAAKIAPLTEAHSATLALQHQISTALQGGLSDVQRDIIARLSHDCQRIANMLGTHLSLTGSDYALETHQTGNMAEAVNRFMGTANDLLHQTTASQRADTSLLQRIITEAENNYETAIEKLSSPSTKGSNTFFSHINSSGSSIAPLSFSHITDSSAKHESKNTNGSYVMVSPQETTTASPISLGNLFEEQTSFYQERIKSLDTSIASAEKTPATPQKEIDRLTVEKEITEELSSINNGLLALQTPSKQPSLKQEASNGTSSSKKPTLSDKINDLAQSHDDQKENRRNQVAALHTSIEKAERSIASLKDTSSNNTPTTSRTPSKEESISELERSLAFYKECLEAHERNPIVSPKKKEATSDQAVTDRSQELPQQLLSVTGEKEDDLSINTFINRLQPTAANNLSRLLSDYIALKKAQEAAALKFHELTPEKTTPQSNGQITTKVEDDHDTSVQTPTESNRSSETPLSAKIKLETIQSALLPLHDSLQEVLASNKKTLTLEKVKNLLPVTPESKVYEGSPLAKIQRSSTSHQQRNGFQTPDQRSNTSQVYSARTLTGGNTPETPYFAIGDLQQLGTASYPDLTQSALKAATKRGSDHFAPKIFGTPQSESGKTSLSVEEELNTPFPDHSRVYSESNASPAGSLEKRFHSILSAATTPSSPTEVARTVSNSSPAETSQSYQSPIGFLVNKFSALFSETTDDSSPATVNRTEGDTSSQTGYSSPIGLLGNDFSGLSVDDSVDQSKTPERAQEQRPPAQASHKSPFSDAISQQVKAYKKATKQKLVYNSKEPVTDAANNEETLTSKAEQVATDIQTEVPSKVPPREALLKQAEATLKNRARLEKQRPEIENVKAKLFEFFYYYINQLRPPQGWSAFINELPSEEFNHLTCSVSDYLKTVATLEETQKKLNKANDSLQDLSSELDNSLKSISVSTIDASDNGTLPSVSVSPLNSNIDSLSETDDSSLLAITVSTFNSPKVTRASLNETGDSTLPSVSVSPLNSSIDSFSETDGSSLLAITVSPLNSSKVTRASLNETRDSTLPSVFSEDSREAYINSLNEKLKEAQNNCTTAYKNLYRLLHQLTGNQRSLPYRYMTKEEQENQKLYKKNVRAFGDSPAPGRE